MDLRTDRLSFGSHRSFGQLLLQDTPTAVQTRHHGTDRDVEDLRRVLVAEVADVDEHDRVAEVMRHRRERSDRVVLRESLDHALLVRVRLPRRLLELVVEEVVAFLERLAVGRALSAAAAIDVQVGENSQEPGAQVRARREGAPAAEGARVGLLHQILGLLAGGHEAPSDSVDLIGKCKRVLLKTNAVAGVLREPSSVFRGDLAHRGHPSNGSFEAATSLTGPAFPLQIGNRKSTRLNSSHANISYAVFCL